MEWKRGIDLVISDIEMPMLDGVSLVEDMRKDARTNDMPVILFSSIMVKDVLDRAEQLRIIHVLKPDIYKLVEEVTSLYKEFRKRRAF